LEKHLEKYKEDMALVRAAGTGDQKAFKQIVDKYRKLVAKVIMGMLGQGADAEDVAQETFIRFYRSMHRYKGDAALGTYLTRIAINLSLNELKRRNTRRWQRFEEQHERYDSGQHSAQDSDNAEWVEKALAQLDEKYRAVVVLRIMQGFSTKETAEILDLPLGTVLSRLARAQKKLKPILKELEK
jgi:RNA polymerase sigma-70 factor (ECF subfamily)